MPDKITDAEKAVILNKSTFEDTLFEALHGMQGFAKRDTLMHIIGVCMNHLDDKGTAFAAEVLDNAIMDGAQLTDLFSRDHFVGLLSEMIENQDWRRK